MEAACAIGVDVGGTKCAAGMVVFPEGRVVSRRLQPTEPSRGGEAVLAGVVLQIRSLGEEAARSGPQPTVVGVGVAELVGLDGSVLSDASIRWKGHRIKHEMASQTGLTVHLEADVRAAARAEAALGAGRGVSPLLYVTVGTGISACLVIDGEPYAGARGLTGTFASSEVVAPLRDGQLIDGVPLEEFASGPALAARWAAAGGSSPCSAADLLTRSAAGDRLARSIVTSGGAALGAAIGQLVNLLDPAMVVIGGGLGLAGGDYLEAMDGAMRRFNWSGAHRDVTLRPAQLGVDAGLVGAALLAVERSRALGGDSCPPC
jgi:glucokinase